LILGRNLSFLPKFDFRSNEGKTKDVKKEVRDFLSKQKGSFSIYYKDLKTGEEFGIDENKVLTGASVNKLIITSYLYNLAKDKKIDLEEKIAVQEDDVQDYGTGVIRYEGAGNIYSLKTLTKLSLEKSDNTAIYILNVKLGVDNVQKYAEKIGLKSSSIVNNETSAKDIGKLLELIYTKKVTSDPLTLEFLGFMKDTDFEDRLPIYLKSSIAVYHKTGDGIGFIHDVGIIDDGKDPFILAVLTSDIKDEKEAKKAIGMIAKIVYEKRM